MISISQYHREDVIGYPVAVARMAVASEALSQAAADDIKGKAAYVLHTWKDFLWDLGNGKKAEVPEPIPLHTEPEAASPAAETAAQLGDASEIVRGHDPAAEEHAEQGSQSTHAVGMKTPTPTVGMTGDENVVSQSVSILNPDGESRN